MKKMYSIRRKVVWLALLSRIVVVTVSFLSNLIIPDHKAGVFETPLDSSKIMSFADNCVDILLGGLVRWDGHYFIHIAMYGYTYENCLAFFPLYPMSVRVFAAVLSYPLQGCLNQYSLTLLSAVVINVVCFVKSADVLYRLGVRVLKDTGLAYKAACLYCFNPASIFFTAPYSEAMFACFTFYGMLMCANAGHLSSSLPFGISGATRSNGVLNLGFIFHERIVCVLRHALDCFTATENKIKSYGGCFAAASRTIILLISATVLSLLPFVAFQVYGYNKFCIVESHQLPEYIVNHAKDHSFVLPGGNANSSRNPSHWCNAALPLAYSYVQSHYWDVGFLKYYHWKQIPNFLLASPMVFLVLSQAFLFARDYPRLCLSLGVILSEDERAMKKKRHPFILWKVLPQDMFVYVAHITLLTLFCVFCIHIQVSTRMIASSTPVFYWFAANIFSMRSETDDGSKEISSRLIQISTKRNTEDSIESVDNLYSKWKVNILCKKAPNRKSQCVYYYFISYFFLGIVLFSNFYPWT